MPLVIINANLIDCIRPDPAPRSSVVVENGRIARVLRGGSPTVGPADQVAASPTPNHSTPFVDEAIPHS